MMQKNKTSKTNKKTCTDAQRKSTPEMKHLKATQAEKYAKCT